MGTSKIEHDYKFQITQVQSGGVKPSNSIVKIRSNNKLKAIRILQSIYPSKQGFSYEYIGIC